MSMVGLMAGALLALTGLGCYHPGTGVVPSTNGTTYVAAHGMVPAGTNLWARIEATGVDGGLVRATTIADVKSADAEEILIPQGSILYGHVTASNGSNEQVAFESLEMEGTTQHIDAEVMTDGGGLTNLIRGTKVQVLIKNAIRSVAAVRNSDVYY